MTKKKAKHPWRGWWPSSTKEYDLNDPHFNPMHPPKGYPQDLLEAKWEEADVTIVEETVNGDTRTKYILRWKEGNN
jgi:hypothetical protein